MMSEHDQILAVATRALLRRFFDKERRNMQNKPGAWEYDHEAAELVEETAKLFGVKDPWTK